MVPPIVEVASALCVGLRAQESLLRAEQAVHGLDALAEVRLHPYLAAGLTDAGFAVFREVVYPGLAQAIPKESERERCDLVVAPPGTPGIRDRVRLRKESMRAQETLFAPIADQIVSMGSTAIEPEEALWIEVKTIGQFTYVDGVAGPNRTYGSQFRVCLADVRKLGRAACLRDAALAVILFTIDEATARHDLAAFVHKCLDADLPVTGLLQEHLPIIDRIGNRVCTLGVVSIRCDPDG